MRSPTETEIKFLKKWINLDIRDSDIVFQLLQAIPILTCFTFFWGFYIATGNDTGHLTALIICTSISTLFVATSGAYRYFHRFKRVDFTAVKLVTLTGKLCQNDAVGLATLDLNEIVYRTRHYIGNQIIYLPRQWNFLALTSNREVSAEVLITPWGKAFPVSFDGKFSVEKETDFGSLRAKPVSLLWFAVILLSFLLSLIALLPFENIRKTTWFAPVEAYRIFSFRNQPVRFTTVHDALHCKLKPYQRITIDSAVHIPFFQDSCPEWCAVIIDPPKNGFGRLDTFSEALSIRAQLRINPYVADLKTRWVPKKIPVETRSDEQIQNDLCRDFIAILKNYNASAYGGFFTNDDAFPGLAPCWNTDTPPVLDKVLNKIVKCLDTLTDKRTITGMLVPRPVGGYEANRFKYAIDSSLTDYHWFSAFFLTITPIILLIMLVSCTAQAILNITIERRVKKFYDDPAGHQRIAKWIK